MRFLATHSTATGTGSDIRGGVFISGKDSKFMCKHTHTSYVQMEMKEFGPFLTVQCDICGAVLPNTPIPDDVFDAWMDGERHPRMDFKAYCRAVDAAWEQVLDDGTGELATLSRIAKG